MNCQFHAGHSCFLVLSSPLSLRLSVDKRCSLKKCLCMRENLLLQLLLLFKLRSIDPHELDSIKRSTKKD